MTITVSTDGSALGNPNGPMGWAWADHEPAAGGKPGHEHAGDCDAGGATNGTNQIGELCAVLEALRAHPGSEDLVIETDSQYAINCSTKWVQGWKRNGWKNSQKKPVKNADLIRAIDNEIAHRAGSVRFVWVKGHAGNAGNEKVDELARTYAGDCRSHVREGYLPLEGWQSLLASEYSRGTDVPEDARMLMDGAISAAEYHMGRGQVSINCCSIKHALYCICVIYTPVHRRRSKSCIRCNRCHINIITYTWNSCCFACCRSTCCICMLADQYTAVRDQSICALFLKVKACPAVCIFYFHCYRRAYALRAKIESCITGDNLCVWECTYITHLACVFFYCAVLDHFIQFQTCNYT